MNTDIENMFSFSFLHSKVMEWPLMYTTHMVVPCGASCEVCMYAAWLQHVRSVCRSVKNV